MTAKKTITTKKIAKAPAKTAKKNLLTLAIPKVPPKTLSRVIRATPRAKTVEKKAFQREASKTNVRPDKKIQTAEGWKRANEKQHKDKNAQKH